MADQIPLTSAAEVPPGGDAAAPVTMPVGDAVAATAPAGVLEQAWTFLVAGGPVVAVLLAMSVVALAIILVKLWQFRTVRIGERRQARHALALHRAGRSGEAAVALGGARNPAAQVLALAIRGQMRGDLPPVVIREEVMRIGADRLEALRSGLRPLEVIASLAPLLGLFGTVLGMIGAFQELEAAGSQVNPSVLSGGIWEALLTTAVGLAVAIPVVAVLNWLERAVDRLAHDMESIIVQAFTPDLTAPSSSDPRHEPARLRAAGIHPAE